MLYPLSYGGLRRRRRRFRLRWYRPYPEAGLGTDGVVTRN